MSEPSICPDCGRNSEFVLHKDGCPQFGREVEEFCKAHEAEVASWPAGAQEALKSLGEMHSLLFRKQLEWCRQREQLREDVSRALAHIKQLEKENTETRNRVIMVSRRFGPVEKVCIELDTRQYYAMGRAEQNEYVTMAVLDTVAALFRHAGPEAHLKELRRKAGR